MITLKLTDGEFMFLYCVLVTGKSDGYRYEDQRSCCGKIADIYMPTKGKPETDAVWEALKGVVG